MITLPDIVGADKAVQVASPNINARQMYVSVTGSNGATGNFARIGDINTSENQGIVIVAGAQPVVFEAILDAQGNICPFSLASTYAYVPGGMKMQIAYEPFGS